MSWETVSHIIFWLFFVFIVVVFIKADAFRQLAIGTKEFFVKLWGAMVHGISDRETYEANKEQREADEAYKKELKSKKKSKKQ